MMSTEEPDPNDVWKYYRELGEAILFPQGSVHDVPEAGDTIFVQTRRGFYHYGIYMGKVDGVNTVIDNDAYDGMDGNLSSIREKTFAQFAHSERVLIIVFEETLEAAIKRRSKALEMARLLKDRHEGQNLYDLINFNCQHFVSVCQGSRWDPVCFDISKLKIIWSGPVLHSKSSLPCSNQENQIELLMQRTQQKEGSGLVV
jgi:hypothetical protein